MQEWLGVSQLVKGTSCSYLVYIRSGYSLSNAIIMKCSLCMHIVRIQWIIVYCVYYSVLERLIVIVSMQEWLSLYCINITIILLL